MADTTETTETPELPPLPAAPWGTMLTALIILFVFVGLVMVVLHYADNMGATPTSTSGEQQLQELRAAEREILTSYGYDTQAKSYRIPVERAIEELLTEAKDGKGRLKSFPASPKAKSDELLKKEAKKEKP